MSVVSLINIINLYLFQINERKFFISEAEASVVGLLNAFSFHYNMISSVAK